MWWRRLAPWAAVAALAALALAGLQSGGTSAVVTWYLLQLALPLCGLMIVLAVAAYAWRRRRWRSNWVRAALVLGTALTATLAWTAGLVPLRYPASLEDTAPALTIRLPSDHTIKVGWGGDSIKHNYHVTEPDQRWAYDLVVPPAFHHKPDLASYGCWGTAVLAPTNATVVAIHDGEPDILPGREMAEGSPAGGNAVALRVPGTGTYLYIAHLQRASIVVEPGQEVAEGQLLGRCGNSGNTSEPHIHIHHQRNQPLLDEDDIGEGLPLYFRDHGGRPMPLGGVRVEGDQTEWTGDVIRHQPVGQ